jgi:uncharacterized protein YeaO (DUF488 family)
MTSARQQSTTGEAWYGRAGGTAAGTVRLKRAYERPEAADGYRVLVDRLWPRGVRRDALAVDAWMKEIGPSDELRRWFDHDAARWDDFAARYRDELRRQPAAALVDELVAQAKRGTLTLVYGAKDELHNQAIVLRGMIERRLRRDRSRSPAVRPAEEAAPRARRRARASRQRAAPGGAARRAGPCM